MNRILRFKPHLRVEPAGDGMVFLVGEVDRFLLKGRLHELVAPLVDGRRTEWEIIEALDGKASAPEVYYTLTILEKKGYVCEVGAAGCSEAAAAFWCSLGVDAASAVERLAGMPVAIVAMDGVEAGPLAEALAGAGVAIRDDAELRIVVTGDYLDRGLEALNRRALED